MQVQSCFRNTPSRDGRCRHHLSSVKTSSPGKWGDTTGIPLALQQTVQCIKPCKRRQFFGQVAQAASLESSPPRSTASKRSKGVLLVSLATKKHHQERAFILTLHLVYIRTCIEPCTTKMTTPSAASAIDKCFGYIESTTQE
jgi:hypothetical protein